jgi:hypothetical protein
MRRTPWGKIQTTIQKRSRSDAEEQANLRVAAGLFNFVSDNAIVGLRHDIFPPQLGIGTKVVFWQPVILTRRRARHHSILGPVFSTMHERIRARPVLTVVRSLNLSHRNSLE